MNSESARTPRPASGVGVRLRVVPLVRSRVLLIDDDELVLSTYRMMLRREFDVDLAVGGQAGLARLLSGIRYDAIICDLQMPELNGAAIYRHLSENDIEHAARFVYCTGADPGSVDAQVLEESDAQVLHKPCTRGQLVSAIRGVVADGRSR